MSSFQFPPPPPPPPKTSSSESQSHHSSNNFSNAHRGFRGTQRGHPQRGRGTFTGHRGSGGQYRGRGASHNFQSGAGYVNQVAGEKRTWPEHQRPGQPYQESNAHPSKRQQMSVAPSVPSFGFALPAVPPLPSTATQQPSDEASQAKSKRKNNQLGLTPRGPEHEDSDADVDEEANFTAPPSLPNGTLPNIKSPAELAAWIAERKKRWPTRARVEEKRKSELDRLKQKVEASQQARRAEAAQKAIAQDTKKDKQRERMERHMRKAEKLRQQLSESASKEPEISASAGAPGTSAKPALLGLDYNSDDTGNAVSGEEDILSLSSSSDLDSKDSSDSDQDDVPEETSSKPSAPISAPPPERKQLPERLIPWVRKGYCKFFLEKGRCNNKQCKFKHQLPKALKEEGQRRPRLYDRLVAQEIHSENLAAVQAIKMLGDSGFFNSAP